jgi:hypothetical protein
LIRAVGAFSTRNVESLAQTWIIYKFHRSDGRIGLLALQTYSKAVALSEPEARAGLNRSS